jgi:hypothetical protein
MHLYSPNSPIRVSPASSLVFRTKSQTSANAKIPPSICLVLLITVVGCGPNNPKTYPVQGRVLFEDGRSIEQGSVEFRLDSESDSQRTVARGKINPDGSFSLSTFEPGDGALPGKYKVIVQQMVIAEGFKKAHQHGPRVPSRYAEYGKSGLTAEVKPESKNAIELKLKKDK